MSTPARLTFCLDGRDIPFERDQSILQAALAAGVYIPHLCFHRDFTPQGNCRVCTVAVGGRTVASCTTVPSAGDEVVSETPEIHALRTSLVQFLFTEGNHFCPSCEQSGNCKLQAVGYHLNVTSFPEAPFFPDRPVDASHPDILLDLNRCILCALCVRASAEVDGKHVFALSGRGIHTHLLVNAASGRLADTLLAVDDKAMRVCPVGVLLRKRHGFHVPLGERTYDQHPLREVAVLKSQEK